MDKIAYKIAVAGYSIDSADDPRTELIELETFQSLDSPVDICRIAVYAPPPPQSGLLEQIAGAAVSAASSALGLGGGGGEEPAFAIEVRGEQIKHGDTITVELRVGDVSARVITAGIQSIVSTLGQTTIAGRTGLQKLANARLNQVYQNQSLGQIVRDLCGQAGVEIADLDDGSTYPYFVVHESKNLLRTLRELAMREAMDLYVDTSNKLTIKKFSKTSADHTLYYGIDPLDLEVFNLQPGGDHILMYGESPSSSRGADSWHWLSRDIGPFRGEVGQGARTLAISDGALRTKDAAATAATAKLGTIKDQSALGRLKLLGRPALRLGDAVELKNVPKPELNGLFKVTSVRHVFNKRDGYVTYVGFSGQGGAAKAGDLLGQIGGALAGAAGALGL